MKAIITTSPNINDPNIIDRAINKVNWLVSELVYDGINKVAYKWAIENNIPIKTFNPDMDFHGQAALSIRDAQMSKYADCALIVWDGTNTGISNLIAEAECLGLNVVVFLENELKDEDKGNPIKNNPIFGEDIKKNISSSNGITTKVVSINDKHLVIYSDPKRNTNIENVVVELIQEVNKLQDEIDMINVKK